MNRQAEYTLIGDLVESRQAPRRRELQSSLRASLKRFSESPPAGIRLKQMVEPTVGDEFQGVFHDLAGALTASIVIRLELLKVAGTDSRYGLGLGPITVFDENRSPASQDGPGWWSARRAIGEVQAIANKPRSPFVRTQFRFDREDSRIGRGEEAAVNAFLIMRDAMVDEMKPRSRRVLLGFLLGDSQAKIAEDEGVTQSNVSQTLSRSGAHAMKLAQEQFDRSAK